MNSFFENLVDILNTWWQNFVENLPSLITGLIIFLLSLYLARVLSQMVRRMMSRRKEDKELTVLITRLVRWTVIGFGILLALEQAGQDVTALLTGLGILGFTVGFALQDVSANLVSGILLLFEQPFDIGDSIEVAGYAGTVKTINIRATEMLTWDGLLVLIPNREVFTNTITNYTRISQRRVGLSVGVGYDSDLAQVEKIALEAVKTLPGVKEDPSPFFTVDSFGDSAINTTVYYWYATGDQSHPDITNAGALAIKTAFDRAGIDIPFPIRTVRLEKDQSQG
jgi:small conductance mechanosensitive channel